MGQVVNSNPTLGNVLPPTFGDKLMLVSTVVSCELNIILLYARYSAKAIMCTFNDIYIFSFITTNERYILNIHTCKWPQREV